MQFYKCRCFCTKHIFISQWNLHLTYPSCIPCSEEDNNSNLDLMKLLSPANDELFLEQNSEILYHAGCRSKQDTVELLSAVHSEIKRRATSDQKTLDRLKIIRKNYSPLNPEIFSLKVKFLHPQFIDLCEQITLKNKPKVEKLNGIDNVFYFPVFTEEFCDSLRSECEHFISSDMPRDRPNTMNYGGILMSELGLDSFLTPLRERYLSPLIGFLCGEEFGKPDSHRGFTVRYRITESDDPLDGDRDLALHYDNCEATLNIHLGGEHVGSELYFQKSDGRQIPSRKLQRGHAVLHLGAQKHRVDTLKRGERNNLIVWLRASAIRNEICPRCSDTPNLVLGIGYADGFTKTD